MRRGANKPMSEAEVRDRLNEIAERERLHEQERMAVYRLWVEARAAVIRDGGEPGASCGRVSGGE